VNRGDLVHIPSDALLIEYDDYTDQSIFKYVDNYTITQKPELAILLGPSNVQGYVEVVHESRIWLVLSKSIFTLGQEVGDASRASTSNMV